MPRTTTTERTCSCCGRPEGQFRPLVEHEGQLLCRTDEFCSLPWRRAQTGLMFGQDGAVIGEKTMSDREFLAPLLRDR